MRLRAIFDEKHQWSYQDSKTPPVDVIHRQTELYCAHARI